MQGEGLPEEETPTGGQEQIASSSIEVCHGEAGSSGEWHEDGVDDGALDADGESVTTKCVSGHIERAAEGAYVLTQIVDRALRRGDQFRGSLGSLDGVGTRTISP